VGIYEELGFTRVINAQGAVSSLGGSILHKEVMQAYSEANEHFVRLQDLDKKAGETIAKIMGADAAHITTGAFAALVLSAAACITGKDREKIGMLPNTTDMKNEFIIQRGLRNKYDRAVEVAGGKFIEIEPTLESLEKAITEKTAAIYFVTPMDFPKTNGIPLENIIDSGHRSRVPIIVDAAWHVYPPSRLKLFPELGVDLSCYSSKYFSGPNSIGFVCGRKDLIEAATLNSFVGSTTEVPFGRGFKLDRQAIVAMVVALQRWIQIDHEKERWNPARDRRSRLIEMLKDVPDIKLTSQPDSFFQIVGLEVTLEKKTADEASEIAAKLRANNPPILIRSVRENNLVINTLFLLDGEEQVIAKELRSLITGENR
jgi:L-seryl-tRNA(Ser) seleniumtransferase